MDTVTNPSTGNGNRGAGKPARQACEVCRERKVRCDRATPKCGRCVRLAQPCGYGERRSSRYDLSCEVTRLQDRLSKAEALLCLPGNPATASLHAPAETLPSSIMLDPEESFPYDHRVQLAPTPALGQSFQCPPLQTDVNNNCNTDHVMSETDVQITENHASALDEFELFANFTNTPDNSSSLALDWTTLLPVAALEPILTVNPPIESAAGIATPSQALSATGWNEEAIPLGTLHQNYFNYVYYSLPFLSKERFTSELAANPNSPAVLAISYAVALMGCTLSPDYAHLQTTCYKTARGYIERCDREADERHFASLNVFQALLFVVRFEIMDQKLSRAWMTIGRAVRMSKMLGLHQMDGNGGSKSVFGVRLNLPPSQDPLVLEERRRSFWGLYILESYIRTRTGMECELGDAEIFDVSLPSQGLLTSDLSPAAMPFLRHVTRDSCPDNLSSYAGCVLMVELALRCFDHGSACGLEPAGTQKKQPNQGFWDEHYALIKTMDERLTTLRTHVNAKAVREDPVAFSMYMNLRATEIFFHEAAVVQTERRGLPVAMAMADESRRRSAAAAFKIATAVLLTRADGDLVRLQASFIAWPLVMAMRTLSRELLHRSRGGDFSASFAGSGDGGVVESLKLLLSALDRIEQADGYWHESVESVTAMLRQWDDRVGLESVAL